MLRVLAIVAVVAAAAWGAYWLVGARALDRTVARMLAENPAVSAQDYSIRGFPRRFELTLTGPRFRQGGLVWQAPFMQVLAPAYRPHHVIVVLPEEQQVSLAGREAVLVSRDARANLVAAPDLALPLERMVLVLDAPQLQIDGASHAAGTVRAASRALDARLHETVIEIEAARPDPGMMDLLDPGGHWPRQFEVARLAAQVQFDRPLDRAALAGPLPRPNAVMLTGARLRAEGMDIVAEGSVEPDEAGRLSGPVTLRITGWPALLERLTASGVIGPDQAGFLRPILAGMAGRDDPATIELSLTLRAGAVTLGPVTLARLPPLL